FLPENEKLAITRFPRKQPGPGPEHIGEAKAPEFSIGLAPATPSSPHTRLSSRQGPARRLQVRPSQALGPPLAGDCLLAGFVRRKRLLSPYDLPEQGVPENGLTLC
uniref:Uncharacterized protein n=1 Tax=Mustela putorius furo TaxID=9669 RepID=M3YE62_MUSPF